MQKYLVQLLYRAGHASSEVLLARNVGEALIKCIDMTSLDVRANIVRATISEVQNVNDAKPADV